MSAQSTEKLKVDFVDNSYNGSNADSVLIN